MNRPFALPFTILALASLAGCIGVVTETDERAPAFNYEQLQNLIGSTKDVVEAHIGSPQYQIVGENKSFFVYEEFVDAAGVAWIVLLPLPVWGEDFVPRCSMLEFDDNDVLSRFELKDPVHLVDGVPSCPWRFWSQRELAELGEMTKSIQLQGRDLYWFCRAAHGGHGKARWRLGNDYHHPGPAGFHTRNVLVAYVWYTLALEAGYSAAEQDKDTVAREMTPDQIAEAERLVSEWEPNPAECKFYWDASNAPLMEHWPRESLDLRARAEADDPDAMYEYAWTFYAGDQARAWYWFCRAAHGGHGKARWRLGNDYHHPGPAGFHTRNPLQAYVWYTLSLESGYSDAAQYKDRVSREMSPSQIAEAERLVVEWEPNLEECAEYAEQR